MSTTNYEEITIESDVFQQARENFDMLLQKLFRKMDQNGSDEGSITLKVDINMSTDWIGTDNGQEEIHKPVLKHKATTAVPVKDSFDGKRDTGMNLVYDDDLKRYVLKYVSIGGQRSIFDDDFQQNMNMPESGKEVAGLPGPSNILPPPTENDIIDVPEDGVSEPMDMPDEEFTDYEEENDTDGDTEATDGNDDDYGYEDPEQED